MNISPWVRPGEEMHARFKIFAAPFVTKGLSWLPVAQLAAWAYWSWWLAQRHEALGNAAVVGWGFVAMVLFLGSEWCHNLSHAYGAYRVGKPVDAIRINLGMPLLAYFPEKDLEVRPREHIIRAIGGPIFNLAVSLPAAIWFISSQPGSISHDLAFIFLGMNLFIGIFGLSPNPFFDGGVILNWWLVLRGTSQAKAELAVRWANAMAGLIFIVLASYFFQLHNWFWFAMMAQFVVLSFLVAFDKIHQR